MYSDVESVEFLAADVVHGPSHVVGALQLPEGSEVIRRARLISREEHGPVELSTSWFAAEVADVAPKLLVRERIYGGTAKYLGSGIGRKPLYARDQVMARLATADERRHLGLVRPAATLVYWLTIYDADDHALQFDEAMYAPGRWAFREEYPLADS
jgi:GntR family transcriptional regulator